MDSRDKSVSRLRWHCRRGMRELDVLLTAWLDTRFAAAAEDEQQAFCQLLALADDELIDYLLGGNSPSNPVLARVVREIRLPSPR